jgi:hypothetical protein
MNGARVVTSKARWWRVVTTLIVQPKPLMLTTIVSLPRRDFFEVVVVILRLLS